ncbi:MAG: LLM class flavin-dependent oxidoreductase [Gemmatimonadota bacterium]|nr:LLM class flavin-dependent oxidoreductase [Gemmatimonadota bacterium]
MPPLKLGVVDQSPVRNGGSAAEAVRETIQLAQAAERLGYTRYWLAEHHSTNSFAGSAPEVLIPQVAAATRTLRVGSGGVMLSHYSPLKVAEQFRMLETLFPGRIDLGIGRAPGGDVRATQALAYGRGHLAIEHFPQQVADLVGWIGDGLDDEHPFRRVRAMPRAPSVPEVWLLGSGGSSAEYAAELGCGYSFAQFISGQDGSALVQEYRERFRPSAHVPEPRASVGISVVCAPTTAEAERLASSMQLWRLRIERGWDRGIPSPEQALAHPYTEAERIRLATGGERAIVGDPERVRGELLALAERYGVDELMIVTVTHDFAARMRSYELLADAMELRGTR